MKKKIANTKIVRLNKRFWRLGIFSLLFAFIAYHYILRVQFPTFLSNFCEGQTGCGWSLLEGYSSLITLAIVIGSLIFAAQEYTRQESQISFEIYKSIHLKLTNPDDEAARRWIIANIKIFGKDQNISEEEWHKEVYSKIHEKPEGWGENISPGHIHLKRVLNTLDYFGFVAENYVNVEGALLEWMSAPVAKVWERIEPYVEKEKEARKEPDFYKSAFYIGKKCVAWRKKQGYESTIIKSGT